MPNQRTCSASYQLLGHPGLVHRGLPWHVMLVALIWVMLALASTITCNPLLVSAISHLIVADLARQEGIVIDGKRNAIARIPTTLASLVVV